MFSSPPAVPGRLRRHARAAVFWFFAVFLACCGAAWLIYEAAEAAADDFDTDLHGLEQTDGWSPDRRNAGAGAADAPVQPLA